MMSTDCVDSVTTAIYAISKSTNGIITIVGTWRSASTHGIEYTITNICGQTVMNGLISSDNQQINLGNLENGMYFIKIGDETVKIIKTR